MNTEFTPEQIGDNDMSEQTTDCKLIANEICHKPYTERDGIPEPNTFRLKIRPEHYAYLRDAITPLESRLRMHRIELQKKSDALHAALYTGKDVDKRLRWDALYAVNLSTWICDNLYIYLNDEHIDSALRCIFSKLNT